MHTGVTVRPQATNCTPCHYSFALLQSGAPLQRQSHSRKRMWAECLRRRSGGERQIQTDGWREHRRCGWTDSSLRSKRGHNAEDFGVWLHRLWRRFSATSVKREKRHMKTTIMLHAADAECDSVSAFFSQRLHAFDGLTTSTSSPDAAVT